MKTGELLIEEGLVKEEDVLMAMEMQERHSPEESPPLIGGLLCQWNMITPFDLFSILKKHKKLLRVGEILIRHGKVTVPQLEEARSAQEESQKPFGKILVDQKSITPSELYHALAAQGNIPFSSLDRFFYERDKINLLSHFTGFEPLFEKKIVPLEYGDETLTIAISRPENMERAAWLIHQNTMFRINFLLIPEEKLCWILKEFWRINENETRGKGWKKPVMILTDPDTETDKIDAIYFRYKILKKSAGETDAHSKIHLFREFIRSNHHRIVRRFQCGEVSYQLEEKEGRVLIHAFPGAGC